MSTGVTGPEIAVGDPGKSLSRLLPRALDFGERAVIALAFAYFIAANAASHSPINLVLGAGESLTLVFILFRRPANSVSLSPLDLTAALLGTLLPMLARPGHGPAPFAMYVAPAMWGAGLVLSIGAKLSLNRRFGIAPANRGVQAHGAYAFVRHPMYAGYLLMNSAYFLVNPTPWNVLVYVLTWSFQFLRVSREESWLRQDAAYRDYARSVRFRFVPYVI